jgi:hypothetical protein
MITAKGKEQGNAQVVVGGGVCASAVNLSLVFGCGDAAGLQAQNESDISAQAALAWQRRTALRRRYAVRTPCLRPCTRPSLRRAYAVSTPVHSPVVTPCVRRIYARALARRYAVRTHGVASVAPLQAFGWTIASRLLSELSGCGFGPEFAAYDDIRNSYSFDMPAEVRFAFNLSTSAAAAGNENVPGECSLMQNYPNPPNVKTVVCFQWLVANVVRLVVYDVLGREVATLLEGQMSAGAYTVECDAGGLASGIYICCLVAGERVVTMRSLLLKQDSGGLHNSLKLA